MESRIQRPVIDASERLANIGCYSHSILMVELLLSRGDQVTENVIRGIVTPSFELDHNYLESLTDVELQILAALQHEMDQKKDSKIALIQPTVEWARDVMALRRHTVFADWQAIMKVPALMPSLLKALHAGVDLSMYLDVAHQTAPNKAGCLLEAIYEAMLEGYNFEDLLHPNVEAEWFKTACELRAVNVDMSAYTKTTGYSPEQLRLLASAKRKGISVDGIDSRLHNPELMRTVLYWKQYKIDLTELATRNAACLSKVDTVAEVQYRGYDPGPICNPDVRSDEARLIASAIIEEYPIHTHELYRYSAKQLQEILLAYRMGVDVRLLLNPELVAVAMTSIIINQYDERIVDNAARVIETIEQYQRNA